MSGFFKTIGVKILAIAVVLGTIAFAGKFPIPTAYLMIAAGLPLSLAGIILLFTLMRRKDTGNSGSLTFILGAIFSLLLSIFGGYLILMGVNYAL